MKINIKFWIGVIIVSILVIIFRNVNFQWNRKYQVNRTFQNNSITHNPHSFIESLEPGTVYTDSIICSYRLTELDTSRNTCQVTYYDIAHFNLTDSFTFSLPKTAQVKYGAKGRLYYIDHFGLYLYTPGTGNAERLTADSFKCLNICQVNANNLLLLGEDREGKIFRTGFFNLNQSNRQIVLSKLIEENISTVGAQNSLIYSGKFTRMDSNSTCYYCDKYCKLFFFDNEGTFVREFITADKTPKPELVSNGEAFFYKRGNTFNVNNAVYKDKDKLLVFSCRSNQVAYLLIDVYSLSSNRYLYSTKVSYKDWNCPDVISVSHAGPNAIIAFQHGTGLFQLHAGE